MITATIVLGSLALALAYACAWLCLPRLRRQIEQPKHWFQDQVRQYDRQTGQTGQTPAGTDMRHAD